jgi:hypothetical protein
MTVLEELDMSLTLSKDEEAERLEAAQKRLLELRLDMAGLSYSEEEQLKRFKAREKDTSSRRTRSATRASR